MQEIRVNDGMTPVGKSRNSNMELLRIIAMFMIVMVHACMYFTTFCNDEVRTYFNGAMNGICNIGVTCFVLISGYYGLTCRVRKVVRMECMMITFSLLETVLLILFVPEEVQGTVLVEQLVKSVLPFITRKYWFYSCYVCLVLLSGYLEWFLEVLDQKALERLLVLMLVLFSVFPTLFYFELIPDNGKGLVQMIMIYLMGRYIRYYKDVRLPRWSALVFLVMWVVNGWSHEHALSIGGIYHHLCKDNSITNICMAVILFYLVKEWKLTSRAVNVVAGQMFAVFALNNTLTTVVMHAIQESGFKSPEGVVGACMFLGVVVVIMTLCIVIGVGRNTLLRVPDAWIVGHVERGWDRLQKSRAWKL